MKERLDPGLCFRNMNLTLTYRMELCDWHACLCVCFVECGEHWEKGGEHKRCLEAAPVSRAIRSLSEHLGGGGKRAVLWAQHCRKASVSILISRDAKALGRKERVA